MSAGSPPGAEPAERTDRLYRTLIEHMPAAVYRESIDGDRERFYVSPRVESLFGFPAERWGDPDFWPSRLHPDDRERVLAEDERTNRTGQPFAMDYRFSRADGEVVWIRDQAVLVDDGDGRPMWQGSLVDITKEKEAELRFRTLVEALPAVTYTYLETAPGSGRYTMDYASPQIEEVMGYPPSRFLGSDDAMWRMAIDPRDVDWVMDLDHATERSGQPFHAEYRIRRADGGVRWVRDEAVLFEGGGERARRWLGVLFDVTDRKEAEENLQQSFDLLRAADDERRLLLTRIVQAQESERQRIAADLHDDPIQKMSAVGLRLETLMRGVDDPQQHRQLETLLETVAGTIERLRHLLFELHPPALDQDGLGPALRALLLDLENETGATTSFDDRMMGEPEPALRVAAYRVAQEAITNVRKHAGAGGVAIVVETRTDALFLRIRDDGAGFDPRSAGTSGHLGLLAMRERAEAVGGRLRVESSHGGGTTVEFWLPIGAPRQPLPYR